MWKHRRTLFASLAALCFSCDTGDSGSGGAETTATTTGATRSTTAPVSAATTSTSDATNSVASSSTGVVPEPGPPRIVFVYTPFGTLPSAWRPSAEGSDFELSEILKPFESLKDRITVVEGLDLDKQGAFGFSHQLGSSLVLTANLGSPLFDDGFTYYGGGGTSLDIALGAADRISPFPQIVLAATHYQGGGQSSQLLPSWLAKDMAAKPEPNARVAFDILFQGVQSPEVEALSALIDAEAASFETRARVQFTLVKTAFLTERTRTATVNLALAGSGLQYTWLNAEGLHLESHGLAGWEGFVRIQVWFAQQIADFAQQLAAVPDGAGTLLDRTTIVWVTDAGFGDNSATPEKHNTDGLPAVIIGDKRGYFKAPYYHHFQGRPHADLLLTIGRSMGLDITSFGAPGVSTGELTEILN